MEKFNEFISMVKQRTDISQEIGKYITLDKNNMALCPFHDDKNPSLSVNTKEQYFHCFGCGKGGDVFKFLELCTQKPFHEILTDLAGQVGMKMPEISSEYKKHISIEREIESILSETALFYHKTLTPEARQYLIKDRGLKDEAVNRFQIGFAKGGLKNHLINICKFSEESCIKSGVLKLRDESTVVDKFYKRIIFPNIVSGRVVYLTGRTLDEKEPKYLNLSKEIRYLYNEDAMGDEVFIVEGIIDCLTLIIHGYNAVCIYGTNNFKAFQDKFKNCKIVYLCLDGDEAGKNASIQIASLLGDKARIILLTESLDPNKYFIKHTKEEFEGLKKSALGLIQYKINQIPSDTSKIELPQRLEHILLELSKMDALKSDAYINYSIKERFNLKKYEVNEYLKRIKNFKEDKLKADDKTKTNPKPIAIFDGLVDLVEYRGSPAFLVKEGDSLKIKLETEKDGEIFIPPKIEKIPFLLAKAEMVIEFYDISQNFMDSDLSLYSDLLDYLKNVSELPSEEHYEFLTLWIMHTYLIENFQYSPILCFFALPERGKSRTGKAIIYLSHRGIRVESLREAYIVRIAESFGASLFFDIRDAWKKALFNNSEDILLNRFEKDTKVPRVNNPDRGPFNDIDYYSVFGPTVIATNVALDKILETRAIIINMPQSESRYEQDIKEVDLLPFKERLLAFRAKHLNEEMPEVLKPADGRLGDILKPILQVIMLVNPDCKDNFFKLISATQEKKKLESLETIEAQIISVLVNLRGSTLYGKLPIKVITEKVNESKNEKHHISTSSIGRILSAMGFDKAKTSNGASAIIFDEEKINKLADKYGILPSEGSDVSDIKINFAEFSEASEVSEGNHKLF